MATKRISTKGTHPFKKEPKYGIYKDQDRPLTCCADILIVADSNKVAVSMNGTAVFTMDEFREFAWAVLDQIGLEQEKYLLEGTVNGA